LSAAQLFWAACTWVDEHVSDVLSLFSPNPALNALLFSMNLCSFAVIGLLCWQFNRRLDSETGRTDEILEYSLRKIASKLREASQKLAQHERALKKIARALGQHRTLILKKLLALSHEQKCLRNMLADISPFTDTISTEVSEPVENPKLTISSSQLASEQHWLQIEASKITALLQARTPQYSMAPVPEASEFLSNAEACLKSYPKALKLSLTAEVQHALCVGGDFKLNFTIQMSKLAHYYHYAAFPAGSQYPNTYILYPKIMKYNQQHKIETGLDDVFENNLDALTASGTGSGTIKSITQPAVARYSEADQTWFIQQKGLLTFGAS